MVNAVRSKTHHAPLRPVAADEVSQITETYIHLFVSVTMLGNFCTNAIPNLKTLKIFTL
jgi:hypothetical protein